MDNGGVNECNSSGSFDNSCSAPVTEVGCGVYGEEAGGTWVAKETEAVWIGDIAAASVISLE